MLHSGRRQTDTGSNTETLHSNGKQNLILNTLFPSVLVVFVHFVFLIALCNTTHGRQSGLDSSTETLATEGKPNLTATEGKQISQPQKETKSHSHRRETKSHSHRRETKSHSHRRQTNLTATEGKQISPFCCSGVAPPLPLPHLSGVSEAVSLTFGAEGCGRRVNQQWESYVVSQMELSR